jgi:hypothetical protein
MGSNEEHATLRLVGVDPLTFVPRLISAFSKSRYVSCGYGLRLMRHHKRAVEVRCRPVSEDAVIVHLEGGDDEVIAWMSNGARAALVDRYDYDDGIGVTSTMRSVYVGSEVVFERAGSDLDRDEPVPDARQTPLPPEVLARLDAAAAELFVCDLDGLDDWDPMPAWSAAHPAPAASEVQGAPVEDEDSSPGDSIPF